MNTRRGIFMSLPDTQISTTPPSGSARDLRTMTGPERRAALGRDPQLLMNLRAAKAFYEERGIADDVERAVRASENTKGE